VANRRLALGIVAVMGTMGVVGLVFALATVSTRRDQDTKLPRSTRQPLLPPLRSPTDREPVLPARLTGLGYLPPGCTLVAGLHVEELLASPIAEPFKNQRLKVGPVELTLESLEGWIGIPAGNIDHVVVGSVLEENGTVSLTPPTVLVVRTREPIGVNRLRAALQATAPRSVPTPDGPMRSIARGKFRELPLTLWLADPQTAVVGLFTDLGTVPSRPTRGNERLADATRQALEQRLVSGRVAWAVVSASRWQDSPLLTALPWNKDLVGPKPPWEQLRVAVVSLSREAPLRVVAEFQAHEVKAAEEWERQALDRKEARLKVAREEEWLSLQWRAEP
jgi:hypothetical protein